MPTDQSTEKEPQSGAPLEGARRKMPALVVLLGIAVLGLVRYDLTLQVEYRWGHVTDVIHIPGRDLASRVALVTLNDASYTLRTSDRLLVLRRGGSVCVRQRVLLVRQWVRRSLALAPYCRHAGLRVH